MDKELFKQSIKELKKARLSNDEKSVIRQSLLNFILQNPLKPGVNPRLSVAPNIFLFNYFSRFAVMSLFLVMAVGGGLGFAAEKALPGDTLYSVKVGFNEEVGGWLAVTDEAKVNWEVKQAQRRLEEAEDMATQGSLDTEARTKIEESVDIHFEKVKKGIEKLEAKEKSKAATNVSAKFEKSLENHKKILDRLSEDTKEEVKKEVRPIQVRVKSQADAVKLKRQERESRKAREDENKEKEKQESRKKEESINRDRD